MLKVTYTSKLWSRGATCVWMTTQAELNHLRLKMAHGMHADMEILSVEPAN